MFHYMKGAGKGLASVGEALMPSLNKSVFMVPRDRAKAGA